MISALDFDIRPGSGLGPFIIGSSLWAVLDQVRGLQHFFPQVDIKYDTDSPVTTPIIVHLRPHLDLLFSGYHQRLHTISVRRLRDPHPPLTLRYQHAGKDVVLSSPTESLKKIGVSRTFGPTYPGDDLKYPGVWFSFDDDGQSTSAATSTGFDARGKGAKSSQAEDRMHEVKKVVICQKEGEGEERDALGEVEECEAMYGDLSRAIVKIHDGVILHFHPPSANSPVHIVLGLTTAQDLVVDLGTPPRVHYKEDDRMKIHSQDAVEEDPEQDYFYNYFQYGMDILISGDTHNVKKIVLHTNVPGTPLFQRYKRCPWEIESPPEDDEDDAPPRKPFYERFETISHFLSPREQPPSMLLDRTDEEEGVMLPSSQTHLFGYNGVVLEVTDSGRVVAVMLF
ncbi:UPF0183-domain-containing protein [Punctularia strigosozonata HHB-11173 SS5]|uniref:UPF0183-domain-containing protein n=1 Tax=Punctularia strigosozonata (strain HHB-11173) TaxID=741275 RepID=UPI0004417A19|nr:UPF0183-domain-containing protein [Punctularia strigosozonata HHB-11173 SS5]EIN10434.1 UPF0183-domain-containing protein [Punctularia strigosozonata HHB-11173 SS5]